MIPTIAPHQPGMRLCIRCRNMFLSQNAGDRVCTPCRSRKSLKQPIDKAGKAQARSSRPRPFSSS